MKKNLFTMLLLSALVLAFLAACGSGKSTAATAERQEDAAYGDTAYDETEAGTEEKAVAENVMEDAENGQSPETETISGNAVSAGGETSLADKLIYSADATIETLEFEASVQAVDGLMEKYAAFLEDADVTGNATAGTFSGKADLRRASYTIRVPKDSYSAFVDELSTVGNVTKLRSGAENVTTQYTDTQSRLDAYETEETRLLALLEQAEDMDDMLTIESRLSDIRYQKESLTSQLANWDNAVRYSTVSVSLREVVALTEEKPVQQTFGQKVGEAFRASLDHLRDGGQSVVLFFAEDWPALLFLGILLVVAVLLLRRAVRRRKRQSTPAAGPAPEDEETQKP